MKKCFTLGAVFIALSFAGNAQSVQQEAGTDQAVTSPTTNVEVTTTSETKTLKSATPVNKTGKPIKAESILDRREKADQRVSKREPKK